VARCHQRTLPSFEVEHTDNPPLTTKVTSDVLLRIVQTASITHQGTARWGGDEGIEWGDTIGERHRHHTSLGVTLQAPGVIFAADDDVAPHVI
jgi:hypothetical protein